MKNADLFKSNEIPFNLAGELLDNSITDEGQKRLDAQRESEARKAAQLIFALDKQIKDRGTHEGFNFA